MVTQFVFYLGFIVCWELEEMSVYGDWVFGGCGDGVIFFIEKQKALDFLPEIFEILKIYLGLKFGNSSTRWWLYQILKHIFPGKPDSWPFQRIILRSNWITTALIVNYLPETYKNFKIFINLNVMDFCQQRALLQIAKVIFPRKSDPWPFQQTIFGLTWVTTACKMNFYLRTEET